MTILARNEAGANLRLLCGRRVRDKASRRCFQKWGAVALEVSFRTWRHAVHVALVDNCKVKSEGDEGVRPKERDDAMERRNGTDLQDARAAGT